ncbi:phage tail assembly chaperone [Thermoactinomyces daqus]|uniref:phage tail assembly chaperone n=1 Tax=Thermoactinomyces daqus TaxID=1329516 RepID=UPI0035A8DC74
MAFGPLGLKPDEFWNMTAHEFIDLYNGNLRRLEDEEIRRYQLVSLILADMRSLWSKPTKPTDIFNAEEILKERYKKRVSREEQERLVELAKERGRVNG